MEERERQNIIKIAADAQVHRFRIEQQILEVFKDKSLLEAYKEAAILESSANNALEVLQRMDAGDFS